MKIFNFITNQWNIIIVSFLHFKIFFKNWTCWCNFKFLVNDSIHSPKKSNTPSFYQLKLNSDTDGVLPVPWFPVSKNILESVKIKRKVLTGQFFPICALWCRSFNLEHLSILSLCYPFSDGKLRSKFKTILLCSLPWKQFVLLVMNRIVETKKRNELDRKKGFTTESVYFSVRLHTIEFHFPSNSTLICFSLSSILFPDKENFKCADKQSSLSFFLSSLCPNTLKEKDSEGEREREIV